MKIAAQRPTNDAAKPTAGLSVVAIAGNPETRRRITDALSAQRIRLAAEAATPVGVGELEQGALTIVVLVCDVDLPGEIAGLRRLRRDAPKAAVVVISPPTSGRGVRRALDAGAEALVFEPELDLTLPTAVRAVSIGQSVVPRKLRAVVEKPVLSHRERQVLTLVRKGFTNAEIADVLYLAESTIKSHLSSAFTKFGVRSRKEAAAVFVDLESIPTASGEDL